MMSRNLLVSIVIDNYNYGQFLAAAIDSALNQTYPRVEVIVVDDGSTDNSRSLIAAYGNHITPVLKKNGGQASAFNAGFACCCGEVVIFLDADDVLLPETAAQVVTALQANPGAARVHYRLAVIDSEGMPTGQTAPPAYLSLPQGDLRAEGLEMMNYATWVPTSGNAFAAWSLRRILPMPEQPFRTCADYYLVRVNALCAPVASLDKIGGYYRSHAANRYRASTIHLDPLRTQLKLFHAAHPDIAAFAASLGFSQFTVESIESHDEIFLAQRLISLKLDPRRHPIQADNLTRLLRQGVVAALHRRNLSLMMKLVHILWFIAMWLVPNPLAGRLAQQFLPDTRNSLTPFLARLQRTRSQTPNRRL